MVGVGKHDLRASAEKITVGHGLDGAAGSDRHEGWRLDNTVRCAKFTTTRLAVGMSNSKFERLRHCGILPPSSHQALRHKPWIDSLKRVRVGVVYGGRSSEHEVSLASAAAVITHLDPERYEAIPICIRKDGRWSLADRPPATLSAAEIISHARGPSKSAGPVGRNRDVHFLAYPAESQVLTIQSDRSDQQEGTDHGVRAIVGTLGLDVVFPVVHGPYGEDGTLQGLLELANVPYVGAGVLGSALAMDKAVAKTLFAAHGLPIVKHVVVTAAQWDTTDTATLDDVEARLAYPLFVKPANLGSSVGITKVADRTRLQQGIGIAREFDRKIVVEEAVPDPRELECGVLGNDVLEVSVPGEIVPAGEFYDYESKYVDDRSTYIIPAELASDQTREIRTMAADAFRAVEGAGMARVDFLLSRETGLLYLNELNTIPGFTTISQFAKLWQSSGLDYPRLLERLIDLALERHSDKQRLLTSLT